MWVEQRVLQLADQMAHLKVGLTALQLVVLRDHQSADQRALQSADQMALQSADQMALQLVDW